MRRSIQRNSSPIIPVLFALCLALALATCATTQPTRKAEPQGFLKDYSKLRKGSGDEAQLIYIVYQSGPSVMRIRVAITEAKASKVVLDIVSTAVPQMRVLQTERRSK